MTSGAALVLVTAFSKVAKSQTVLIQLFCTHFVISGEDRALSLSSASLQAKRHTGQGLTEGQAKLLGCPGPCPHLPSLRPPVRHVLSLRPPPELWARLGLAASLLTCLACSWGKCAGQLHVLCPAPVSVGPRIAPHLEGQEVLAGLRSHCAGGEGGGAWPLQAGKHPISSRA